MASVRSKPLLRDLATGKPLPLGKMTEKQFVTWADEHVRAEWVDGKVVLMSPVSVDHVDLLSFFTAILRVFVEERDLGRVISSEVMVRFSQPRRRRLPDIKFVRKGRLNIIGKNCIDGAPDLIVEIVSPDSVSRDWREKYLEYEKVGVQEYWILDPLTQVVEAYRLQTRKYQKIEPRSNRIESRVLPGFFVKPAWLWKKPLPGVLRVMKEIGIT